MLNKHRKVKMDPEPDQPATLIPLIRVFDVHLCNHFIRKFLNRTLPSLNWTQQLVQLSFEKKEQNTNN